MTRRFVAAGVSLVLALLGSLAVATPAFAKNDAKVSAVAVTAPTMNPGQTAWVSVIWTANQTVSGFAVTAAPPAGVSIGYPAGRPNTSLYGSASLVKKTQDFTAMKVSVPYSASGSISIPLTATWTYKGAAESQTATLTIPLRPYTGSDLTRLTTSASVTTAAPAWVEVRYRGAAPSLDAFRVTATAPEGIAIVYPGDGSSSGLNGATTLYAGIEDFAAFRVDATGVAPGSYTLQLTETYTRPGAVTNGGTLTLVVS